MSHDHRTMAHDWSEPDRTTKIRETCVICWALCTRCRRCKCQVETQRRQGLGKDCGAIRTPATPRS